MRKLYLILVLSIFAAIYAPVTQSIIAKTLDGITELSNLTAQKSPARGKIKFSLGKHTTGDSLIDSYILDSCTRYNVDPLLIYAQMDQESQFKSGAVSYRGARGLMQLVPATAQRFGATRIEDPQQNIEAGVKYMRWLLDKFDGDVALALAGYNAGEGAVMKYDNQLPPYEETMEYVDRITAHYDRMRLEEAKN